MKVVLLMSFIALAAARPQWYSPKPTAGPVYYKPIDQNLFYPSYLQGQFRQARSEETAAPAAAAPAPVETARSDAGAPAAPVVAPAAPVAPVEVQETARSDEGAPAAPAPVEAKAAPAPAPAYAPVEYTGPAAYSYEWLVKDDYTKNDYGQKESRAGANTQGSYHVALPDGRIQTVTYRVDGYGGYVADVSFSGEAQYPDEPAYKPAAKAYKPAPAPAYKPAPAPAYKPAPAPAPAPVYKPKPAPVYHAHPAPSYPIQPAASVRRYSFRTINDAPVPKEVVAEEARSAAGIEVEVLLDDEPLFLENAAAIEIPEEARSAEGVAVVVEEIPVDAPIEEIIEEVIELTTVPVVEEAVEVATTQAPIVEVTTTQAPIVEEIVEVTTFPAPIVEVAQAIDQVEEILEPAESKIEAAPVVAEAPREEKALVEEVAEEIAEVLPAEEEIFEVAESKVEVAPVVVEEVSAAREAKALAEEPAEEVAEAVEEAKYEAPAAPAEEAALNYRYYYRY